MRVLVIGAHVDDAECGCGGTIARHIEREHEVQWHTLISGNYRVPEGWPEDSLEREYENAMKVMGIENFHLHDFVVDTLDAVTGIRHLLYQIWQDFQPDVTYVPWKGSRHQDHRAVGQCSYEVSWRSNADSFMYVVPNDYLGFVPNTYSILDSRFYQKKLEVLAAYRSQVFLRPWFTNNLIDSHSRAFAVFAKGEDCHVEPFIQVKRLLT